MPEPRREGLGGGSPGPASRQSVGPLPTYAASQGGFSVAVVGALLNMVWAGSGIVGPSLGGALAQGVSDRATFGLLAVFGFGGAWWMWRHSARVPG